MSVRGRPTPEFRGGAMKPIRHSYTKDSVPQLSIYTLISGKFLHLETVTGALSVMADFNEKKSMLSEKFLAWMGDSAGYDYYGRFPPMIIGSAGSGLAMQGSNNQTQVEFFLVMQHMRVVGRRSIPGQNDYKVERKNSLIHMSFNHKGEGKNITKFVKIKGMFEKETHGVSTRDTIHGIAEGGVCDASGCDNSYEAVTTMVPMRYRRSGKEKKAIFVASVTRARGWPGRAKPTPGFSSTRIFVADVTSLGPQVEFTVIKEIKGRGVLAMEIHLDSSSQMTQLFFACFTMAKMKKIHHIGGIASSLHFATLKAPGPKQHAPWYVEDPKLLAGNPDVIRHSPVLLSEDGTGKTSTFTFVSVSRQGLQGREAIAIGLYGGAALTIMEDPLTKRSYLVVGEGGAMKMRMVDITSLKPEDVKVTTASPIVGPHQITTGLGQSVIVFDSQGSLPL